MTSKVHPPADELYFRHLLATMETLPTLPPVALEGIKRALNPAGTLEDLSHIVELDPPLTAKVLQVANTPYYGKSRKVTSLQEAFSILGFPVLRSIILSVSAMELFSDRKQEYGLDLGGLWEHSIGTAVWARQLAPHGPLPVDPEEAFITGLLHDIGKVVFCSALKDRYKQVIEHAREQEQPLFQAERERLGYDHTDASLWLMEEWRIPTLYCDAVFHHHHTTGELIQKPYIRSLCRIVQLSDQLCYQYGIGQGGGAYPSEPFPHLLGEMALSRDVLDTMHPGIEGDVRELLERLDWRSVSQAAYLPHLMEATRALADIQQETETRKQNLLHREKELKGINALGLGLQGCTTLREAIRNLAETLVTAFPFREAFCTLFLDDKWELLCQARRHGKTGHCRTLLMEQNRQQEPYAIQESEGPMLFVDLIGKEGPLGYMKVQPDREEPVLMDKVGLLLASCAKLASEVIERIQSQQQIHHLSEHLKRSLARLDQEKAKSEKDRLLQESIYRGIPLGLLLLDTGGRIRYVNPAAVKLLPALGKSYGKPLKDCFPEPLLEQGLQEVLQGRDAVRNEAKVIQPDTAAEKEYQWTLVPLRESSEEEATVLFVLEDITEERALQKGLYESARMASIGELAAGTAHNLRSPLGAVKGILELLLEEMEAENLLCYAPGDDPASPQPTHAVKEQLEIVLKSLNKSFSIIDDLLQFARRPDRPPEFIRLSELLDGTEAILGELLQERGIRVEKELPSDQLFGRKSDLIQVFLNLYSNAYKAMPRGGRIRIKSRKVLRKQGIPSGVEIVVSDTGCGIPEENLDKIFDPFYTTSERVEGTGLGLSLTRKIVKEHGGTLAVTSEVGTGTVFQMILPDGPDALIEEPSRQPE